jgi:hypothetical protein
MVPPVTLAPMRRSVMPRPGRNTSVAGILAATLVVAVLAGCGGGDDSKAVSTDKGSGTGSTSAPASTTPAAAGASGTCTLAGASTATQSTPATEPTALLTDVRASVNEGCDRVVFQFRDASPPGYDVSYRPGPFNKGESNEPLDVEGSAYLVVRFDKASGADMTSPTATPTYTGSRAMTNLGLTHAVEVTNAEDFEGIMTWVIGLDAQRPFKVTTLSSPPRVVVDVS